MTTKQGIRQGFKTLNIIVLNPQPYNNYFKIVLITCAKVRMTNLEKVELEIFIDHFVCSFTSSFTYIGVL